MPRTIIKQNELNIMYHNVGITTFNGCQCFKDCFCSEDFKPMKYNYYTVQRKNKKTTRHETLEDANIRWDFVCTL
jgi:hypothetical protein